MRQLKTQARNVVQWEDTSKLNLQLRIQNSPLDSVGVLKAIFEELLKRGQLRNYTCPCPPIVQRSGGPVVVKYPMKRSHFVRSKAVDGGHHGHLDVPLDDDHEVVRGRQRDSVAL